VEYNITEILCNALALSVMMFSKAYYPKFDIFYNYDNGHTTDILILY
jgi:hypothetical protein